MPLVTRRLRTALAGAILAASLTPISLVASAPSALAATTNMVAVANVNLRTGPGMSYSVITLVPAGSSLTATGATSGNWIAVTYAGRSGWVYNTYVTATAAATTTYSAPAASAAGQAVADYAESKLGAPYSIGSKGPTYFDCSGLVTAAHAAAGVYVPYSMTTQATTGDYVARSELQPGDVVVWEYNSGGIRAVSIYIGDDKIVIADGYTYGTRIDTISNRSSWSVFGGGRRHV